jgi:hypothetical protein
VNVLYTAASLNASSLPQFSFANILRGRTKPRRGWPGHPPPSLPNGPALDHAIPNEGFVLTVQRDRLVEDMARQLPRLGPGTVSKSMSNSKASVAVMRVDCRRNSFACFARPCLPRRTGHLCAGGLSAAKQPTPRVTNSSRTSSCYRRSESRDRFRQIPALIQKVTGVDALFS